MSRTKQSPITRNPELMGGTPVFAGTRVPISTMINYLERGHSLDDFLYGFPSVTREHAIEVLELMHQKVLLDVAG